MGAESPTTARKGANTGDVGFLRALTTFSALQLVGTGVYTYQPVKSIHVPKAVYKNRAYVNKITIKLLVKTSSLQGFCDRSICGMESHEADTCL